VLDDLDVVHPQGIAIANELDRLQRSIADIDTPGKSWISHDVSSCRQRRPWAGGLDFVSRGTDAFVRRAAAFGEYSKV
jgi:hypothetical protein